MTYYDDWNNRLLDDEENNKKASEEDEDVVKKLEGEDEGRGVDVDVFLKDEPYDSTTHLTSVQQDEPEKNKGNKWRQWRNRQSSGERREWKFCDTKGKRIAWGIFGLVLVITAFSLLIVSLEKLDSTQYGVEYNTHKKILSDSAKEGGLHLGPPGYKFIKFPSTFVTKDLPDGTCVSMDGLRVQFSVTFQYAIPAEWLIPTVLTYRGFEKWANVVAAAGNSAVQHTCSEFNISDFQNKRGIIQLTMEDNLRLKLEGESGEGADGVYARAISLQLRNIELPDEYQQAVREKQSANEDISLAQNQRTQETTKARTALLSASEEARKILDNANNDAELLLTEARLKAQETLFAFATEATTLVDVKEMLNLTNAGVLTFMTNELLATVPKLTVSTGEPAQLSRKDEL